MLDKREDVRQDLAGMVLIGQTIDHRHTAVGCKRFNLGLLIGADHHQIDHAADHFSAVFNRFSAA